MRSRRISRAARQRTLQYRTFTLPTQKLLHRWGKADNGKCPLCGDRDGGHHALSACRSQERLITERHHGLARILIKAILRGRYGTNVRMTDIGRQDKLEAAGMPHRPSTIPASVLPKNLPVADRTRYMNTLKPDALLVLRSKRRKRERLTVWAVEIKFTRDSDPQPQEERARQQHERLRQLVTSAGHDFKLHTLLVGVGGTIYNSTKARLIELGVAKPAAETTLRQAHLHAVRLTQRVWRARQQRLASRRGPAPDTHCNGTKRKRPTEDNHRRRSRDNGPQKARGRPKHKRRRTEDGGARKRARFK